MICRDNNFLDTIDRIRLDPASIDMKPHHIERLTMKHSALVPLLLLFIHSTTAAELGCSATARSLHLACGYDVKDDYFTSIAACIDSQPSGLEECVTEFDAEVAGASEECSEVFSARLEVCEALGDAPHDPEFGEDHAASFVDPLQIGITVDPNPWFPLVQGNVWIYEGTFDEDGEEVTETITVTVTDQVKVIEGITCLVVIDVAEEDGEVVESTADWFAQDVDGNLWYCGEISRNFESFEGDDPEDPELVDIEGSWKSGREDAQAGILFPADPVVGDVIRQELAWTDAEDVIEILSLEGDESTAVASCNGQCLVTRDFSPLEPGVNENKYFVRGIGLILETIPGEDERVELIDFQLQ